MRSPKYMRIIQIDITNTWRWSVQIVHTFVGTTRSRSLWTKKPATYDVST